MNNIFQFNIDIINLTTHNYKIWCDICLLKSHREQIRAQEYPSIVPLDKIGVK